MLCQFQVYSKVNQLYIYIYPLFFFFLRFFSHICHYRLLSRVPCAIQQVLISYLFYIQQCVYVNPNLPIYPSPHLSPGNHKFVFFFKIIYLFIYLFILDCVGSSLLHAGFLQLRRAGATLCCSARASHCGGISCCRAQALGARASVVVACGLQQLWLVGSRMQAQQLWHTGSVSLQHVGQSQNRAQTHVPCIGRQILNHCTTREAPKFVFYICDPTVL